MKQYFYFITFLFLSMSVFSQTENATLQPKNNSENRAVYLKLSSGIGLSMYRDFATSPLPYAGILITSDFSRLRTGFNKETILHAGYFLGMYNSYYNDHINPSTGMGFSQSYGMMYRVSNTSSKDINVKVGGMLKSLFIVRINPGLMNNGYGYEWLPTLFGSAKITFDVSRKQAKEKDFLIWKYKLKPRKRAISYQLNIGIVNAALRNGLTYLGQSVAVNNFQLFDNYKFTLFSGLRFQSSLSYTIHLHNKNAIALSYDWEALTAENDFSLFEMSFHVLKFAFLFNTK